MREGARREREGAQGEGAGREGEVMREVAGRA